MKRRTIIVVTGRNAEHPLASRPMPIGNSVSPSSPSNPVQPSPAKSSQVQAIIIFRMIEPSKDEKLPNEPISEISKCLQTKGILNKMSQTSGKNEPIFRRKNPTQTNKMELEILFKLQGARAPLNFPRISAAFAPHYDALILWM